MKARCIGEFPNKKVTFKVGEVYVGAMVNENWYCIEAIGVSKKDFDKYFKEV